MRQAVRIADDEGHRHGFAKGPAKAKHDHPDGAGAHKGKGDRTHHLERRTADAVGAFTHLGRNAEEKFAEDGGHVGQDHHGQD